MKSVVNRVMVSIYAVVLLLSLVLNSRHLFHAKASIPEPSLDLVPEINTPFSDTKGFQAVRHGRKEPSDLTQHISEATVVMTSNGFEVLGVFEGEVEHNNLVLGALPHRSND